MLRPQHPLVDGERAAEQGLGRRETALGRAEGAECGEGGGHLRMVRAERALRDGERAAEQGLGRRVLARGLIRGGEQAQAERDARVLGPDALGVLERGREEALGLGIPAPLVRAVARAHRRLPALPVGGGLSVDRPRAERERERGQDAGATSTAAPVNCASRRG
jgi:hypothetical protein